MPILKLMPSVEECEKACSNPDYFVGKGAMREVFRIPGSFWVYKQLRVKGNRSNIAEFAAYIDLKDNLPEGIRLPEMHLLPNGVLAAEFINGEFPDTECTCFRHTCLYSDRAACFWTVHDVAISKVIWDGHSRNVMLYDGYIYIIDLNDYNYSGV